MTKQFKDYGREFSVTCLRDESPLLFYHMYLLYIQIFLHILCILCYTICMNKKYIHARTCVYNIHYHIVWCVKYRRKVLSRRSAPGCTDCSGRSAPQRVSRLRNARSGRMTMYTAS